MALAISAGWIIGWVIGVVVVALAAALLILAIAQARRIASQASDITEALDGTRRSTEPMYDIARANLAIDRIGRGLARVRGERGG